MSIIDIKKLRKDFTQSKRKTGFLNYIRSLFHQEYETVHAVHEISFSIKPGEFVGFLGPNGAGKTTTLKMLSGILFPTSGDVTVLGHTPSKREPNFQRRFSLIMGQKNQMWWDLPVIESFLFNKEIYEIPDALFKEQKKLLCELLDIEDLLNKPVRKLSLGERMKCELATALLHKPEILFLDEPTIGLDVVSQKRIRDFLLEYNKVHGATIILTSHYMEDIRRLCERVIIIDHGKLIYDGSYNELTNRYADTKTIEVSFRQPIEESELKKLGKVIEYAHASARISVSRKDITGVTTKLLELPIEDISIQEESMEEIVREIFTKPNNQITNNSNNQTIAENNRT